MNTSYYQHMSVYNRILKKFIDDKIKSEFDNFMERSTDIIQESIDSSFDIDDMIQNKLDDYKMEVCKSYSKGLSKINKELVEQMNGYKKNNLIFYQKLKNNIEDTVFETIEIGQREIFDDYQSVILDIKRGNNTQLQDFKEELINLKKKKSYQND